MVVRNCAYHEQKSNDVFCRLYSGRKLPILGLLTVLGKFCELSALATQSVFTWKVIVREGSGLKVFVASNCLFSDDLSILLFFIYRVLS